MVGISPSTTPSEFKILEYIGLYGTSTGYDLSKKKDPAPVCSDKTAYTLLPNLVENGFLSVTSTKRKKTGRDKKEYSLTVLGVSRLVISRAMPRILIPIIRHWSGIIPKVLGVWNIFQNIDEDVLHSVLNDTAHETMRYRHAVQNQKPGFEFWFSFFSEVNSEIDDETFFTYRFYWDLLHMRVVSGRFLGEIEDLGLQVLLKELLRHNILVYTQLIEIFERNLLMLNQ